MNKPYGHQDGRMAPGVRRGLIVVGVDDSPESLNAARYALHEGRSRHWQVRLVHAYGSLMPGTRYAPPNLDRMERAAQVFLDGFVAQLQVPDGVHLDTQLCSRTAVDGLLEAASEADLVVVGHHCRSWGEHLIPGSVAIRLAGHADVPVLVVPAHWHRRMVDVGPVVVAVDAETPARGPLRFAFRQAEVSGQALTVLHAVTRGRALTSIEHSRDEISEALEPWRAEYPDVSVVIRFVPGDADSVLTEATQDAVLLVVGGPHEEAGFSGWLGSVGRAVLKHAACPVAIIPQVPAESGRSVAYGGYDAATNPR